MITVEQALALVAKHSLPQDRKSEKKALEQAQQAVLAQEVVAPIALPPFRQSAMDGYAVHLHDSNSYQIIGTIQAGDDIDFELQPGQACRIFTGAAVPHTANAVVIQELVIREENQIKVQKKPQEGQNIRKVGEQVEQGTLVLEKGFVLNPPALGLLQSLGLKEVLVYAKPKITILITGNELQQAGKPLTPAKIYESNSLVLQAALQQMGITKVKIQLIEDDLNATVQALKVALEEADLVLISGGISVGDFDFAGTALQQLGVEEIFYKVKQKPGKPLYFGKHQQTYLFALPGNPASTLNCFYVYVYPLLEALMGKTKTGLMRLQQPLAHDFENTNDRALFLKASLENNKVSIRTGQASSMIKAFAEANALVYIPHSQKEIKKGEAVQTLLLPHGI